MDAESCGVVFHRTETEPGTCRDPRLTDVDFNSMSTSESRRLDRLELWLLIGAAIWGLGLVLAAFLVPAYSSNTGASFGSSARGASLVQENGLRVLFPVATPLVAVGLIGGLVGHRRRAGKRGPGVVSWIVVTILGGVTILGILTIGVFILPVTALLLAVCLRSAAAA